MAKNRAKAIDAETPNESGGVNMAAGVEPAQLLRQLLADALSSLGGGGGVITIWDTRTAKLTHLTSASTTPGDQQEIKARLDADLAGLLTMQHGGDSPVRLLPQKGWQVSDNGLEANLATARGPLHLVLFPVHMPGPGDGVTDSGIHTAAPDEEDPQVMPAPGDQLVGLLAFFHPEQNIVLRQEYPGVLRLLSAQLDMVLLNTQLLRNMLREAQWLEAVLQHTSEGLVIIDAQGKTLGCNRAFERLSGWSSGELWGRDLGDTLDIRYMRWLNTDADEEAWNGATIVAQAAAAQDGESQNAPQTYELVIAGRKGQQIYTEAAVSAIKEDGMGLQGAVVSFRDVTAEREAEELQATFLSVISHELQTPLAVIRGYAELLSDSVDKMKPAKMREKLDIVAEESERLSGMVSNLLDASRIQAGGLELHPEPVDIGQLVRRVVQKVEPLTAKHHFVIGISADTPSVLADYDRIEQVVTNLVENAIKYSPSGGAITITADQTSEDVILHISDEGIGVPEAERRRIFSRFARLDSRVVRQMKGFGLGLYISRAIILAHGGRIWVDSAPGGGAQFSFSLPRQNKAPLPVLFGR